MVTDHKNLQWMMNVTTGKIARWTSLLSEYQVKVVHRSGKEHIIADFLSRHIAPDALLDTKETLTAFMMRNMKRSRGESVKGEPKKARRC